MIEVLSDFPPEDRSPAVKDLDLKLDSLRVDHALGIHWNVENDMFNIGVGGKILLEASCCQLLLVTTLLVILVPY